MSRSKPKHSNRLRAEDEWYVEPAWAIDALAEVEEFNTCIYDPACGMGVILDVFAKRGHVVYGDDLVWRGFGEKGNERNFLTDLPIRPDADVVCNPPYLRGAGTVAFIDRAIQVGYRKSCFIVNESFLFSRKRMLLFSVAWPLRKIWFLSDRPSMPPGDLLISGKLEPKGGTANYAWLVFELGYSGPTECGWIGKKGKGL